MASRRRVIAVAASAVVLCAGAIVYSVTRQLAGLTRVHFDTTCTSAPSTLDGLTPSGSTTTTMFTPVDEPPGATFDWNEGKVVHAGLLVRNESNQPVRLTAFDTAWGGPLAASAPIDVAFHEAGAVACGGEVGALLKLPRTVPAHGALAVDVSITMGHCSGIGAGQPGQVASTFGSTVPLLRAHVEQDGDQYVTNAGPWDQLQFSFTECER